MHTNHHHWKIEHDAWQRDIHNWQSELEAAISALDRLRHAAQQHGQALQAHAQAIAKHEAALEVHEHAMASNAMTGHDESQNEAANRSHERQAIRHLEQRQAHEQFKRDHDKLVAEVAILKAVGPLAG
jgi:hypothetical protein